MAKSIEEKVEEHYKDCLKELGITYYGKTQASQLNESIANALMTIWRKSPYFSEGMDSLSLGLVESYFLYALYFWSLTYLSTT
ncbi:hypothetical protein PV940_06480, partial [Ligilactobacillus salivarius]|nr:hypothetical protein [Ligilactobacillus salivarius]